MDTPKLIIQKLEIPQNKRLIAISDIHGELDLFKKLLDKVGFCHEDILVILGDFYLKGSQPEECFRYVYELDKRPNAHVLRGNCEWGRADFYTDEMWDWVCNLPIILESEDFIFVHAALEDKPLDQQDVRKCLTTYAFMETYEGKPFDKWVMVGHWPTDNYCHDIPCYNPIVDEDKGIISIDGGAGLRQHDGQLNALIVLGEEFDWASVDNFPTMIVKCEQIGTRNPLSVTFNDRFVEIVDKGEEFAKVRHQSGKVLEVPNERIWQDDEGRNCVCDMATDFHLPVKVGDEVSVIATYSNKIFARKDGIAGWINL